MSDWAFIIKSVGYAVQRFQLHTDMLEKNQADEHALQAFREQGDLFPDMDYRIFQKQPWL